MADTRAISQLTPEIWDDTFTVEWYQQNPFSPYSGTSENNPIRMKEDFQSKRGNGITFEFITRLGRGTILDRQPLRGHESQLGEYGDIAYWRMRKQGISYHEVDADLAAIDLRRASKTSLRNWADEDVKFEAIDRLQDVGAACNVPYPTASTTDKNAWCAANSDRILFGSAKANYSATLSTGMGTVDSTSDKLSRSIVSLAKRMALTANPRITPIRVESRMNRRYYVMFAPTFAFRDFKADTDTVQEQVFIVEKNEEIFIGGDREYDGVIVHEVDDMPVYTGLGNGGIDIAPCFLMGTEALGWAMKSRFKSRTDKDDYGQEQGLGMFGKWGMKKLCYQFGPDQTVVNKQRGLLTVYVSAVAD